MKDGVKSISFSSWANVLFHTGNLNCISLTELLHFTHWLIYLPENWSDFVLLKNVLRWRLSFYLASTILCIFFFIFLLQYFVHVFSSCIRPSITLSFCHSVYSHFYFFITRKMMEWSFDDRVWCYHSPCYQSLPLFAAWLLNHTPVPHLYVWIVTVHHGVC